MTSRNILKRRIETSRIVAIYSLFGLAWIYFSDTMLGWLIHDPVVMVKIAVLKGSFFILCTATLLYFLINRFIRQLISAEASQLESLKNYETIFNTTSEAIFIHDALSGRILDINDRMLEIYGYTRDEALSVEIGNLSEGAPPYSRADAAEKVRKTLLEGPQVFEWHSRKKNGELFWSEVSLRQITIHGADRIIAVVRDISERKRAEDSFRTNEAKFRSIVETSQDWIWEMSVSGKHTFSNARVADILGYSIDDFLLIDFLELVHQEDRQEITARLPQLISEKRGWRGWVLRWQHKDGSYRFLESNANPILNESGELVGFRGVDRDITERKTAEDERLNFEHKLLQAQKLESLGVLAGGIAHDFNNILTAIMGNISYAKMDHDVSQHAYEPLVRAEKAVKRAASLAKQLLVFSKGGEPVKKIISVRQAVADAVSLVLSGSSVEAVIDLPSDLHTINADEGQISQAFNNIIINAVQAMPDGGKLTISAQNEAIAEGNSFGLAGGDYIKISFTDEGCGIAAEDMGRIFDPYFTNKSGGSGLGLASTYTIIKKHGGHISVSSSPGKGATFIILLPGCDGLVSDELNETHMTGDAQGIYSILVMDDDEMVRELADITLKRFGYEVVCCDNGAAAVSLYRTTREEGVPFSLVIMDLTIPGGMGGIEAARQILDFDPEAQLIVSSGYSDDPVMARFSDYGFCAALEKPYNVEKIAKILQKISDKL